MFKESPFRNLSVPSLIERIEGNLGKYSTSKNPEILEDVSACIVEARRVLNVSLEKTDPANAERISTIERKYKELQGLEERFKALKGA